MFFGIDERHLYHEQIALINSDIYLYDYIYLWGNLHKSAKQFYIICEVCTGQTLSLLVKACPSSGTIYRLAIIIKTMQD